VAQRVVVVVALGDLVALAGSYIVSDGFSARGGGWFNYVPDSNELFFPDVGLDPFPRLVVWAAVVIVWAVVSFWIVGLPATDSSDGETTPTSEGSDLTDRGRVEPPAASGNRAVRTRVPVLRRTTMNIYTSWSPPGKPGAEGSAVIACPHPHLGTARAGR
jgi:hypothetical protein